MEEYFQLQPIKKEKKALIDKLEKVRTVPQQMKKHLRRGRLSILVRVERVELSSYPWEGHIIAVIRHPRWFYFST